MSRVKWRGWGWGGERTCEGNIWFSSKVYLAWSQQTSSQHLSRSSTSFLLSCQLHPRGAQHLSAEQQEALWLNALRLLAANSLLLPLGWPLLWTYDPRHSVWCWETVQGLLIKYYSPLNGWRLASVGMLGLNLPPGQMCVCVYVCMDMKRQPERVGVAVHGPGCKCITCFLGGGRLRM